MSATIVDDPVCDAALKQWIGTITAGARATSVEHVSGGAFRSSARVHLEGGHYTEIFLKIDLGSAPHTGYDLAREFELLGRLESAAIRAPKVLGFDAALGTLALEHLPGDARYIALGDDVRATVEQSFVEALAEVHRIDVATLRLEYIPSGRTAYQAIVADLTAWRALLIERVQAPDDATLFAFAWLAARMPATERPAVLVQGDAGPGNFLFDRDGVVGLIDWEMAHLGHPLEDLGCVLARSLVQPMMGADRLISLYEAASGTKFEPYELIYATVLVMTRFNVPILLALEQCTTALDYVLTNSYFRLSQISMLTLIASAEGVSVDDLSPLATAFVPSIRFELDYLAAMLGDLIRPRIDDDYGRYRLDGAIGLINYLKLAACNSADTSKPPNTLRLASFEQIVAEGKPIFDESLRALLAEAQHREHLMAGMLGPLKGRRVKI